MSEFYQYQGLCLCPRGGQLPEGARAVSTPFAPLLYLVDRDPRTHGALRPIMGPEQLDAPEDWRCLLPRRGSATIPESYLLNTAFPRALELAPALLSPKKTGLRLSLVGLGDVGGQLLTALKLLGGEIAEIGIYDPNEALIDRYLLELNQILDREEPRIVRRAPDQLFDCDLFLFTASRGVPPVGAAGDVRMLQFEKNREMLRAYAGQARDAGFRGLFCQISDPVDLLARSVFLQSNRNEAGELDFRGLLPEQIVGFGLGVMRARADFMVRRMGASCPALRVYGPHGAGLVVANDPVEYDETLSLELTRQTVGANLEVRALGFKPYIAPAISSACISILQLIRGELFHGAIPMGGAYFGCCARRVGGFAPRAEFLHPDLTARIEAAWKALREEDAACLA
ncbi:MAG: lactate dehydrogenase [Oscillospiraceae bacterium]|nr:lactate dehydrogenase [Oscillospiraceae bacterium]